MLFLIRRQREIHALFETLRGSTSGPQSMADALVEAMTMRVAVEAYVLLPILDRVEPRLAAACRALHGRTRVALFRLATAARSSSEALAPLVHDGGTLAAAMGSALASALEPDELRRLERRLQGFAAALWISPDADPERLAARLRPARALAPALARERTEEGGA